MNKIILLLLVSLACFSSFEAQITLQGSHTGNVIMHSIKLQNSGYKHVKRAGATIELYNTNHSLLKQ